MAFISIGFNIMFTEYMQTNVKIIIMLEYITVGRVGASKIDESRAPIFFQETNLAKTPTLPNDTFSFFRKYR